ncbi:MAG TPA: NAD(P)H-dependent oxidoreductase, partial [Chryseolinea sp.]|nr:NAD(P)H-dependent oxidoreductase [Chryseolinea sp.]
KKMKKYNIAVLVGSLRKESYNLKVAKALMKIAPESLSLELVKIGDLPMYNEESDANPPEQYTAFREKIKSCDGVLFLTPEYNRSVPAVLKNAIDVGSRPYGKNSWAGKPGGVVSVSISSLGGFGANHHLRQSLVFVDVRAMPQPEAYIASAQNLFNEKGELINDSTKEFLESFLAAFERWVILHTEMEIPV